MVDSDSVSQFNLNHYDIASTERSGGISTILDNKNDQIIYSSVWY